MPKYNLVEDGIIYDTVECLSLDGAVELASDPNDNHDHYDDVRRPQTFSVRRYVVNTNDPGDHAVVDVIITLKRNK